MFVNISQVDYLLDMCRGCLEKYPEEKIQIFQDIDELLDIRLSLEKPKTKSVKSKLKKTNIDK
jgi:hypothetical protein